jgi:ABC-type Fe3+-hydroxamate transport system substrate-binding protein
MTHHKSTYRRVILGFTALATAVVIAACGSSSSSTTSTTTSTTSSASRTTFVKCMQDHGVTIAAHPDGATSPAGAGTSTTHSGTPPAGAGGSGSANPTREAAFKACGATGLHPSGG